MLRNALPRWQNIEIRLLNYIQEKQVKNVLFNHYDDTKIHQVLEIRSSEIFKKIILVVPVRCQTGRVGPTFTRV